MKLYKQCNLALGDKRTVGWIETRGALAGARVEIDGDFWTVTDVGTSSKTMEDIDRVGRAKMPSIN